MYDMHRSGIKPHQSVYVSGGPIGVLIGLYLRCLGAWAEFGEVNPVRIKFLTDMGFPVLDSNREDALGAVRKLNGGELYDVASGICAVQASYEFCIQAFRPGSRLVLVAITTSQRSFPIRDIVVNLEKLVMRIYPFPEAKEAFMHSMSKSSE